MRSRYATVSTVLCGDKMLARLTIRNVALIESAELEFSDGLNVLSGETGAGKSVILDSIDFVLGAKADKSMIRYGADFCFVCAEFSVEECSQVHGVLSEMDIESDSTIVISRKLSFNGKGSLKINGISVTSAMLRRVTPLLVDVHGQSEHFFLLKESNQLRLLDTISGKEIAKQKAAVAELVADHKKIISDMACFGVDEGERIRKLDVLRFQIEEIERADLREGEEEKLLALRTRFLHAEKILSALNAAREYILSDGGAADAAMGAQRAVASLIKISGEYSAIAERLENAAAELSDIGDEIEKFASECDFDERESERVENRLDEINGLKKKYGTNITEIISFCLSAQKEYQRLTEGAENFERLKNELEKNEEEIYLACTKLTALRKIAAESFTERVINELKTLNISSADFQVYFEEYGPNDAGKATSEGLDSVRFLFSANAGEPLKELNKIISGGEMSRFMLAVKAQMSAVNEIGTYIFDEIDAGIGGKTARSVAEKFCGIARSTQIIAVSHLAQIAAFAEKQFLIEKKETAGKTFTEIKPLDEKTRLAELVRLLSGEVKSEFALKHAQELLRSAEIYKNSLSQS